MCLGSILLSLFVLSACLPEPTPLAAQPPTATATITVSPTVTGTIMWFPPTATYTAMPVFEVTPTVDPRPLLGDLLLEDSFTDKTQWQTTRTGVGSIAYGKGELTLAVAAERGSLASFRKTPQLSNYYLEIDILPSMCRDGDAYGLLLRASTPLDYYRLLLNCGGQLRMERLKNGKYTILQDWLPSGQVPPGGMMHSRVGVWAQADELRVFVNDVYQFTVKDSLWKSGTVGVFARSSGESPLTVNFSNMAVYNLSPLLSSTRKP
jgi:hypothetical protein